MEAQRLSKTNCGPSTTNDFMYLAGQTEKYAKMANCRLTAISSPNLPYFNKLSHSDKTRVLQNLTVFNDVCEEVISNGKSIRDSATLIWYGLKKLELRFPSDLFGYMTNENVVEIYDKDNIQIFRNFGFFEVTSYTLEELLCRPWVDLFSRVNQEHTQSIVDTCAKFYTKELTMITPLSHVGVHRIIEADSPFSLQVDAVINYVAPIYDKTRFPMGFIAIETASLSCDVPVGRDADRLLSQFYQKQMEVT